ncbi:unnamed protein product [Closterium sp. NIES-64]|nr:unnamed protein product [Closterium sp. NIES-64]
MCHLTMHSPLSALPPCLCCNPTFSVTLPLELLPLLFPFFLCAPPFCSPSPLCAPPFWSPPPCAPIPLLSICPPLFVRIRPSPRLVHRQPSNQPATYGSVAPPSGEQRTHASDVAYDSFQPADVACDVSLSRVLHEGSERNEKEDVEGVREMEGRGGIGEAGKRESVKRKFVSGEKEERQEKERKVEGDGRVDKGSIEPLRPPPPLAPHTAAAHPPPCPRPRPVIVWDLDETLIIFQSLLSGKFAKTLLADRESAGASGAGGNCGRVVEAGGSDSKRVEQRARELGEAWERLILDVCDDHFFFKELEDVDLPNLCHVEAGSKPADVASPNHGDGSIARPKQPAVSACSDVDADAQGISSLLTPAQEAHRQQLYAQTDRFTHGWLAAGRRVSAGRRAGAC